jgi:hypothetical protein|tara:strand:- start:925 stop:1212 length:288 start_codon:yes stop_codon:yes gene_type:complete
MKMTLVIDTDDPTGVDDAFKMICIMQHRRGSTSLGHHVSSLTIAKIPLIKALRAFAKEQASIHITSDSEKIRKVAGLKDAKLFAERMLDDQTKPF